MIAHAYHSRPTETKKGQTLQFEQMSFTHRQAYIDIHTCKVELLFFQAGKI